MIAGTTENIKDVRGASKGTWEDGVLDYQDIAANYLTNRAFVRHFNQAAKVPFFSMYDQDSSSAMTMPNRFATKSTFLKERQLGGAIFWEITADREGVLLDLVARDLLPGGR